MKKRIWVIDDDVIYQVIINKLIEKSHLFSESTTYKNGKEAIDSLNEIAENTALVPDIILLDINMPIMDGWEFMEEMKQIKPKIDKKIKTYIVSSSIALEDKRKSKQFSDIFDYISKPITVEDIKKIAGNE